MSRRLALRHTGLGHIGRLALALCTLFSLIGRTVAAPAPAPPPDSAFARLAQHLQYLQAQWHQLGPPRVPLSGKSVAAVLAGASESVQQDALARFRALYRTPEAERAPLLRTGPAGRRWTELDLFMPGYEVERLLSGGPNEAALAVEIWLDLAAAQGRKDVLLLAAGHGLQLLRLHLSAEQAVAVAAGWGQLPIGGANPGGRAQVLIEYGHGLARLGRDGEALAAYRRARMLFYRVGDRLGEANTWYGEAGVLFESGENRGALAAYRCARAMHHQLSDRVGEASAWQGEAQVLVLLGQHQEARRANRRARILFQAEGSKLGEANTWDDEAELLLLLRTPEEARAAYHRARALHKEAGDTLGEANSINGEAEVCSRLGQNHDAITSYRDAREIFQQLHEELGEANTWHGEADVLLTLGSTDEALQGFRRARGLYKKLGHQLGEANTW